MTRRRRRRRRSSRSARRGRWSWSLPITAASGGAVQLAALSALQPPPFLRVDIFWVNINRRVVTIWVIATVLMTVVTLLGLLLRRQHWLLVAIWATITAISVIWFGDHLRVIIPVVVDHAM